ncbi:MAG: hypothetical protein JSR96_14910 [Proteobacteria bacterium]|nr:hypothetical protein [Pseudomonadota bacterium]
MKNHALTQWRERKEPSYGAWLNLPDLYSAEMLARMGFDWVCIDLQHGLISYSDLLGLVPALSGTKATVLVRVTSNDAGQIGRALDAGGHGVIVPMVNTAEEAAQAVAACRYPPQGTRSCGPMRDAMLEGFEYLATANSQIACVAMIETREGLANVKAIAATPGLDGLFIGPMDLCYGIGITPGSFGDPAFIEAVDQIKQACADAGIAAGMFGYNAALSRAALEDGFQFSSIGSDANFLREGAKQAFDAARGLDDPKAAKGQPGY